MLTLDVGLDRFVEEVKRRLPKETVYLSCHRKEIRLTAASPDGQLLIRSRTDTSRGDLQKRLDAEKILCAEGSWTAGTSTEVEPAADAYIAAVAYQSSEIKPGVWMDAYPAEPTVQEILKTLFDEFLANGEVADISFEDFLRLATPNVVVLRPDEVRYHLSQKE